jgi:hypothetical protein
MNRKSFDLSIIDLTTKKPKREIGGGSSSSQSS